MQQRVKRVAAVNTNRPVRLWPSIVPNATQVFTTPIKARRDFPKNILSAIRALTV
jgi:hypothetical protein